MPIKPGDESPRWSALPRALRVPSEDKCDAFFWMLEVERRSS